MSLKTVAAGGIEVQLTFRGDRLHAVTLPESVPASFDAEALSSLLTQLAVYPLDLEDGPPFYRKVWEYMHGIPLGSAVTYREVAEALGNPRAVRAVGQACGANRLLLIVPCHRVLAEDGLGGFGLGLPWKLKLLELESELAFSR
ncbi:methylated-DNA--[protein]-cysteine S-methyltransferase [Verrucomicrobiota bacterium sgz303538]